MKLLVCLLSLLFLSGSCAGPSTSIAPPAASVRLLVDETEIAFHDPQVLSVDDANERFEVTMGSKTLFDTAQSHAITLILGELRLVGNSWGADADGSQFVFHATPEQARSLADALGVPAREREAFRGELRGRLEPAGDLVAGAEHLPLHFTLTNTGPVALWFLDGGRGRNELGRDDRFRFEIEHAGERLATRQIHHFGGMAVCRRLAPGESWIFHPDLVHWRALDRAGSYTLRASYEAELMPAQFEPGKVLPIGWYAHLQRTRTVTAELTCEVR